MFLLARRSLSAFSTIWTFSTGFFYNIFGLLRALTTGFRQSATPTLQYAWPLTEQQIYRRSHNFFGSVDEDAIRALGTQHHVKSLQCEIKARYRGSFNGCFVLEFTDGSTRVVRLPLDPAVQDAWDKVRSEVCTMQYLRRNTNIPVPRVYAYGRSQLCRHASELQVFIIMEQIQGHPLTRKALETSPEPRRRLFLQQLVDVFAELRKLPFTRGGSLMPSNNEDIELENPPDIVGAFSIRKNELQAVGYTVSRIVTTSAKEFFDEQLRILQHMWTMPYKDLDREQAERDEFAQRFICQPEVRDRICINSTTRSFFLAHPDLLPGNILVDDELNICGIIDWEYTASVPQCAFAPPTWITGNDLGLAHLPSEFTCVLSSMKEKSTYHSQLAAEWGSRDPLAWSLSHILIDPAELDFVFWETVMPNITGLCDIPVLDDVQLRADVDRRLEVSRRFTQYLDVRTRGRDAALAEAVSGYD
ncbi:kinase-like domain-containing protein [Ilyonectria sp. MPI-CAGE-AT-0026]|nr:kinase-like domain-containing protein [Ilyonectria sp. MPI-CAGE-AT-0026]